MTKPVAPTIPPLRPVDRPRIDPIPHAAPEAAPERPVAPVAPSASNAIAADRPAEKTKPRTRLEASDRARPRTLVTTMVLNLNASRIALVTADGPPYRGGVDTDLPTGVFRLEVDHRAKLWLFAPNQVRSGLRFSVTIDGPDPFDLEYTSPLLLTVTNGLEAPTDLSFKATVAAISKAVSDQVPDQALAILCQLSEVDLYDVLDELWTNEPGVVNDILLKFEAATKRSDLEGQEGVLRALESFARPPREVYVDAFDSWAVHPRSFQKDDERERAGLRTTQLLLTFALTQPRSLIVYADDIGDATEPLRGPPVYGPSSLTYPPFLSKGTTPRLYAAKVAALREIEQQNAEFFVEAFRHVATVLLSVYQASSSLAKMEAASSARGYKPRAERGPGWWEPNSEGGANMSEAAETYELTSCGTPKGMGYKVDGVQFEGFKNGKLLDAKRWMDGEKMSKALEQGQPWAARTVFRQAEKQLAVARAHGVGVQWRVAGRHTADMLRQGFRTKGFPIEVVYIAP